MSGADSPYPGNCDVGIDPPMTNRTNRNQALDWLQGLFGSKGKIMHVQQLCFGVRPLCKIKVDLYVQYVYMGDLT